MLGKLLTGSQNNGDSVIITARGGRSGDLMASGLHGKYREATSRKTIFWANAIVTAPVIFSTAAGTGGPLIWNGSSTINVNLLKVGWGLTTASGAAGSIGLTGGTGQTAAPSSTTAIDGRSNGFLGGAASLATPYRVGTVATAGAFFFPLGDVHTGAVTVDVANTHWVDVDGLFEVPPDGWISIAGSATLTSAVMNICLVWEEIPVQV